MAQWLLRHEASEILEPSMGEGAFLSALGVAGRSQHRPLKIWGVELAADTFAKVVTSGLVRPEYAVRSDFLALAPFPVDAAIGNPPYVRLRHLPKADATRALGVAKQSLGHTMDPSGSVWMPFVLHASRFLRSNGRMTFVLPYDLTYVRYARPLWSYLARSFSTLRIVRVHERMFPDILQDVVLFFGDGFGGDTSIIQFEAYERVQDLIEETPCVKAEIDVTRVVSGERPFVESLISSDLRQLLTQRLSPHLVPTRDLVRFNIGYVTGDKTFFHPTEDVVRQFDLPAAHLRPALTSSRQLRGIGVRTSALSHGRRSHLYLPNARQLTPSERSYVRVGEQDGVSRRFKCRVREPWFVTPGVKIPDVLLPVFADVPLMLSNDAGLVASNSLLCGYLRPEEESAESFLCRWYTSLTLLQVEIEVHALGGGVRIFVPNEAGAVRLPRKLRMDRQLLDRIDRVVRSGDSLGAYAQGDESVLERQLGLQTSDVDLIREGVETLAHWRNAVRTSVRRGKERATAR